MDDRSISNVDPLHIETTTHDIRVTTIDGLTTQVDVEHDGVTTTYTTNRSAPYIDLGDGSFAKYRFEEYDQTEIDRIEISNGASARGKIEFVVTNYGYAAPMLTADSSATFGVVYTAEVRTGRQALVSTNIATHGPIRGDFP